jgi:hypothetical protein
MNMKAFAVLALITIAPTLGGCGAFVAGAAGGLAAGAVIEHNRPPPPLPPLPPAYYYQGY